MGWRGSLVRWTAVLSLGLLLLGVFLSRPAAAADGEHWIPAYNTLAGELNDRLLAVNQATNALKDAARDDGVNQNDLYVLRAKVRELMQFHYVLGPDSYVLTTNVEAEAFPAGLRYRNDVLVEPSLMDGIGAGGWFTKVPAHCTDLDQTLYADNFKDVPPLWVHFEELHRAIGRLRYVKVAGTWTASGEGNEKEGQKYHDDWLMAKMSSEILYDGNPGLRVDGPPLATAYGDAFTGRGKRYIADIKRRYAYHRVSNLWTGAAHAASFYVLGWAGTPDPDHVTTLTFDDNGDSIRQDRWVRWDTLDPYRFASLISSRFGGTGRPAWCAEPAVNQVQLRGYYIRASTVILDWAFAAARLTRPEVTDSPDDGLCVAGCECTDCPPEADVQWQGMRAGVGVTLPLGLSSGLLTGGCRVKAYLTEYDIAGERRQMYSLETRVLSLTECVTQGWAFATLKRPSGAERTFAFKGRLGGHAVEEPASRSFVTRNGNDCTLLFPDAPGGPVAHRFAGGGGITGVRMTIAGEPIAVAGSSNDWPGMRTFRVAGRIASNASASVVSVPYYTGNLVSSVSYLDRAGRGVSRVAYARGSKIFTTSDGGGAFQDETRVVENPAEGSVEIWRGVTTNGAVEVTRKDVRQERWDETNGTLRVREEQVLWPDTAGAQTSVTLTVLAPFAWGDEVVSRTVGEGTEAAQTSWFTYYTNATEDAAAWSRLKLAVEPDGAWELYEYDATGREAVVHRPFKNSPPGETNACRATRFTYAGDPRLATLGFPADDVAGTNDDRPRLVVETVLNREVARTYHAYLAGCTMTRQCPAAGARFDAAGNLGETAYFDTSGTFAGRPRRIEHADGTRTVYRYGYDAAAERLVTTNDTGAGTGDSVTNGTRTITVEDAGGRVLEESRADIASGILLARTVNELDGVGRVLRSSNTVDGAWVEHEYGCCGPERTRDAEGTETRRTYDRLRQPYSVERLGATTYSRHDVRGELSESRACADGEADRVTAAAYDAAGRLSAETNENGFATQVTYGTNAVGESVVTTVQPDGGTRIETCYRDGRLKSVSGSAVSPVCYDYGVDDEGPFTVEYAGTDTNAAQWVKTRYDRLGRVFAVLYPGGYEMRTTYDARGKAVRTSDGLTSTLTEYNERGELFREGADMDGNGVLDLAGTDRVRESECGYTWFQGVPVRRLVTRVYGVAGSAQAAAVSEVLRAVDGSRVWAMVDGVTNETWIVRDRQAAARTERLERAAGGRTVSFFTNGLLMAVREESAAGERVWAAAYAYDGHGRPAGVECTGPDGGVRSLRCRYDAAGQVTNASVSSGGRTEVTRLEYDAMGRVARTVAADGAAVSNAYTALGGLESQAGGHAWAGGYAYDEQGRLTALRTWRQGGGAPDTTGWAYDAARGWLADKTYADGSHVSHASHPNGARRSRQWARGVTTDYGYDAAGSLTNTVYSDGTPAVVRRVDRQGRPVEVCDGSGTRTNAFTVGGVLRSETWVEEGVTVESALDAAGRRTNLAVRLGGAVVGNWAYGYDAAGRLERVSGGGIAAEYTYAADGRRVAGCAVRGPGGATVSTARTFDELGRVATQTSAAVAGPLVGWSASRDAAGRVTTNVLADGRRWVYRYDSCGELVGADAFAADGSPADAASCVYAYDAIGNRVEQRTGRAAPSVYLANALNQYTNVGGAGTPQPTACRGTLFIFDAVGPGPAAPAPPPALALTLSYDADGNLTGDGETVYGWDAENRLVSVAPQAPREGSERVAYRYDYLGRRACKAVEAWDGGRGAYVPVRTTAFIYDGWNLVAERCVDCSTMPWRTNVQTYAWGLDLSDTLAGAGLALHRAEGSGAGGIGGLLWLTAGAETGGVSRVCVSDPAGNVVALVDAGNGTTAATYEYGPFGEPVSAAGPAAAGNPFRFSSKYLDAETADSALPLYYFGHRFYTPALGRWLNRDPLGEDGGPNLYAFVANAPLQAVDPLGLALYAFDGTWNDREKMKRPTNVAKLAGVYRGIAHYEKGVGTDWYSRLVGGATGAGGQNRIEDAYEELARIFNTPDPTGENQKMDVIGFSRGAALARTFVNYINRRKGVPLLGPTSRPTGVVCPVTIRFLGLFDTVASFGLPGNDINWGQHLGIPANVQHVRHAVALDEKRGMFPLSSVLSDPNNPSADPRIVERGFAGAHADIGGGYEDGDRSNIALMWMHGEAVNVGVPFGPLRAEDTHVTNPIIHDERGWLERWRNRPREIYYYLNTRR